MGIYPRFLHAADRDVGNGDFTSMGEAENESILEPIDQQVSPERGISESRRSASPVYLRSENEPQPEAGWNPLNFAWSNVSEFIPPRQFWWPNLKDPAGGQVRPEDPTPLVYSVEKEKSASVATSSQYSKTPADSGVERNSDEEP